MARLAVFGAGAWGSAVAIHLSRCGHTTCLWAARESVAAELQRERVNRRFLPGVPFPESLAISADPALAAHGAELGVIAIPTVYLRPTLPRLQPIWHAALPVLSLTKGLEAGTFLRPTEIMAELLGARRLAALSGPSHAEEVARGLPASLVVASADAQLARDVQRWLTSESFRVYTNNDLVGVELAGALKNVIALAAGIGDGLGLGDNAKAALMARSLAEMSRFVEAHGGRPETVFGLAGLGDLVTTCVSPHGRNRRVGERLGRGESLAAILAGMEMVAEGVTTCRSVAARAQQLGLDLPVVMAVLSVLEGERSPQEGVRALMSRPPTDEDLFPDA